VADGTQYGVAFNFDGHSANIVRGLHLGKSGVNGLHSGMHDDRPGSLPQCKLDRAHHAFVGTP